MAECGMCDGEDGPAIARVRMRDWDNSQFTVNVCKQCKEDHADETVRVLKGGPKGKSHEPDASLSH